MTRQIGGSRKHFTAELARVTIFVLESDGSVDGVGVWCGLVVIVIIQRIVVIIVVDMIVDLLWHDRIPILLDSQHIVARRRRMTRWNEWLLPVRKWKSSSFCHRFQHDGMKRWRRKHHRRWIDLLCSAQFILEAKTIEFIVHFWCSIAGIVAILVIDAIVVIIIIGIVVVVVIIVAATDIEIVFATIIIVVVINSVGSVRSTAARVANRTLGWFLFNDEILIFIFNRIVR